MKQLSEWIESIFRSNLASDASHPRNVESNTSNVEQGATQTSIVSVEDVPASA